MNHTTPTVLGPAAAILAAILAVSAIAAPSLAQAPAAPDSRQTKADALKADLFIAVCKRDLAGVKSAIARGAAVEGRNWLNFTPIQFAASRGDMKVVDYLLTKGANVNGESIYGSPLTFAANGRNEEMALHLLDRGAKPNPARIDGATPLMLAATDGKAKLVSRLIQMKADVNQKDQDGATALMYAARNGRMGAAKLLMAAGARAEMVDSHGMSALMYAAKNGHAEMASALIAAKSPVNAMDKAGATALHLAARYSGDAATARALLKGGAKAALKDATGQSAWSLAQRRGFTEAAAVLRTAMGPGFQTVAVPAAPTMRQAVENAVNIIQTGMGAFAKRAQCSSCHHQGLALMAIGDARQKGYAIDEKLLGSYMQGIAAEGKEMGKAIHRALGDPEFAKTVEAIDINDFAVGSAYLFSGLAALGVPANPGFNEMAVFVSRQQLPDGRFNYGFNREPMQSCDQTTTALAIRVLKTYGRQDQVAASIEKARNWLLKSPAIRSEDRASRLMGLVWAGSSAAEIDQAAVNLIAMQRPDGGWAEFPNARSDAYATGMALYALSVADRGAGAPAWQRGAEYLIRTQDEDGSWYINKQTAPWNTYFDAGFPHGESQYASLAATCWATMALAHGDASRTARR